jgi:peptidoglycan/LPS O-acetylase OafA/YrhL
MATHQRVPALDGLRFVAAIMVAASHYINSIVDIQRPIGEVTALITTLSGFGMTLFFVLSGFVIHWNYRTAWQERYGLVNFAVARLSRLYPLYIVVFTLSLVFTFRFGSTCKSETWWTLLAALPFYLTLTQDWVYAVVCDNSLIYQYRAAASVTWSISAEVLFYGLYVLALPFISRLHVNRIVALAGILYLGAVLFFFICSVYAQQIENIAVSTFGQVATVQYGYNDSLLRWLLYFNPLVRFAEFACGVAVASMVITREPRSGTWLATFAVFIAVAVHFSLYAWLTTYSNFIGRTASSLYAPLIAALILAVALYPMSHVSRLLASSWAVKLGEASYSIYLLHAFYPGIARRWQHIAPEPWLLLAVGLTAVLIISRFSYVYFERPIQRLIRRAWHQPGKPVIPGCVSTSRKPKTF